MPMQEKAVQEAAKLERKEEKKKEKEEKLANPPKRGRPPKKNTEEPRAAAETQEIPAGRKQCKGDSTEDVNPAPEKPPAKRKKPNGVPATPSAASIPDHDKQCKDDNNKTDKRKRKATTSGKECNEQPKKKTKSQTVSLAARPDEESDKNPPKSSKAVDMPKCAYRHPGPPWNAGEAQSLDADERAEVKPTEAPQPKKNKSDPTPLALAAAANTKKPKQQKEQKDDVQQPDAKKEVAKQDEKKEAAKQKRRDQAAEALKTLRESRMPKQFCLPDPNFDRVTLGIKSLWVQHLFLLVSCCCIPENL